MTELATLGLSVNSNAADVSKDLNRLVSSAEAAERSTQKLGAANDANAKRATNAGRAVESLSQKIERQIVAEERLVKQMQAADASYDRAAMSMTKMGDAADTATIGMNRMSKAAQAANQNVRLTGNQIKNLGFQANDAATMLLSGSSAMQVLATQGGQVVQALGDHPGGVKGSLKAIGESIMGLATRTNLIVAGLTAAAAGAIYFATRSDSSVKDATEALERYKTVLDDLTPGFETAAKAAENAFKKARMESPAVALAGLRGSQAEMQASLAREIENLFPKTQGFVTSFKDLTPTVLAGQEAIRGIGLQLQRGEINAMQFRERIAEIRNNATGVEPVIVKIADGILDGSLNARDLAVALQAAAAAAGELNGKMGRFDRPDAKSQNDRFGGAGSFLQRMDPEAYDTVKNGLKDQAEQITNAVKAANAYTKTLANQRQAIEEDVASLRQQADMFGQSEGAIAAARYETQALAEARRAALEANKKEVDPETAAFIKSQAAEYGNLTDKLKRLNEEKQKAKRLADFDDDLQFRMGQLGRSDIEQRVAAQMRSVGLSYGSAADAGREATIRFIETMEEAQDRSEDLGDTFKDAFGTIVDAIGRGENAFDSFIAGLAQIGQKMAAAGFDRLFGGLFGGGQQQSASSFATKIGTVAASVGGSSSGGIGSDYARSSSSMSLSSGADLASSIRWAANTLGTSAKDLATVISYETGGTFSPSIKGGAGGKHLGLIQFGPDEQKQYGAHIGQGVSDQMKSVVSYLQDRGFKQGMSLLDLYSTINAGSPGRYKASDAANGGAPGTVYDKVTGQMAGHMRNADLVLGAANDNAIARGVSSGMVDYSQKAASGAVPGLPSFPGVPGGAGGAGGPQPSFGAQSLLNAGWDGFGGQGKAAFGAGLQTLGAGLGAFANGYQSGSVGGGALSGLMAGLSTGSPVMAVGGAIIGAVGGAKGKRKAPEGAQAAMSAAWDNQMERKAA